MVIVPYPQGQRPENLTLTQQENGLVLTLGQESHLLGIETP
jgi:hypothetical protein